MLVAMDVTGLTLDPINNAPVVVLREREGTRVLPIWLGVVEASAIALLLEHVEVTRPMTHDLLRAAIEALGAAVERVLLTELKDDTYFAEVALRAPAGVVKLDARPSDAIALALRAQAPIWCEERVIEAASRRVTQEAPPPADEPKDKQEPGVERGPRPIVDPRGMPLAELLAGLAPEDFGKYEM